MRSFVVVATLVGTVSLTAFEAGGTGQVDVAKMVGQLKSGKNAKDRIAAAEAIGSRGAIRAADVKNAIEPLKTALKKDPDGGVRGAAARALGQIAPDAEKTVPLLVDALTDKVIGVRIAAMDALAAYGPNAASALPKLREIAKDKTDKKLSQAAAQAAKAITGKKKK